MTPQDKPPWEIAMLLRGLERAYQRCQTAHDPERMPESAREAIANADDPLHAEELRQWAYIPDPEEAPLAVHEFLSCIYSLEEWLEEQEKANNTGYVVRRRQDPDGHLLLAMRFARDRHAHQGVLCAATAFTLRSLHNDQGLIAGPFLFPARFTWRNLADIREPIGKPKGQPFYEECRRAYETDLADREALPTLKPAMDFLTSELRSRSVG